jgi:hypothetical protein
MRPLRPQRPQGFRDLHQNSAKPNTSRVRMVARRMKNIFVKGPNVQRNRERIDIEDSRTRMDEAFGYHSDQIGVRDDVQSLQVVRNGERNVSLPAFLPQPRIHWIFREFPPNNGNMPRLQKLLAVSDSVCDRVPAPHRARVAIGKETLLIKALELIRYTSNRNVHEAREFEWVPCVAH